MVKICLTKEKVTIEGHANSKSAHEEFDLVCAAVSTLTFAFIDYTNDNKQFVSTIDNKSNRIEIVKLEPSIESDLLFDFLAKSFKNLAQNYQKHIKIKE